MQNPAAGLPAAQGSAGVSRPIGSRPAGAGSRPAGSVSRPAGAVSRPAGTGSRPNGTGSRPNGSPETGNGASPISTETGEQVNLLPPKPPPNPEDPKDKGCDPLTVERHCTDIFWMLPFLALLVLSGMATDKAIQVGNWHTLMQVPDYESNICGEGVHKDKPFLYFCMKKEAEWVFDEADKSLEIRYPICKESCPHSFNTSSRCFVGPGEVDDEQSWDWVQDYPTQPTIHFCRPHRAYSKGLSDDFWTAVSIGPKIIYVVLRFYNGWPEVISVSVLCSATFSLGYIISLSKCARVLIWSTLTFIAAASGSVAALFAYCYQTGNCKRFTGNEAGDPEEVLKAVGCAVVALYTLRTMRTLSKKLDSIGKIIEMACRCIFSRPLLTILPMVMLVLRLASVVWVIFVVLGLYSSDVHDRLDQVKLPWVSGWSRMPSINRSVTFRVFGGSVVWFYFLFNVVLTAICWFVMIFVAQVWYFAGAKFATKRCTVPYALWCCLRYHSGTMVLAGLVHFFIGPLHATLGNLQEGIRAGNPLAIIIQTCCSCCLDFYEEAFAFLNRDALQDVSLQAFGFYEGALHISDNREGTSLIEEVALLGSSTFLFQVAGVGCAGVISWLAVAQTLSDTKFTSPDSQYFVEDKSLLCLGGAVLSFLVALPFMTIFDVVSEAVLYSKVVDRQRNPKKGKHSSSGIFRNCSPWRQTLQDITSCNCAYRNGDTGAPGSGTYDMGSMGSSRSVQGAMSISAYAPSSPFSTPA